MDPSFNHDPEPAASPLLPRDVDSPDLSKRAQWLRAAVLGANDGILSIASLMMGVGAVRGDPGSMIVAGVAGLIAGACSMAIGELVSVYSQYDIEYAQIEREAVAAGTSDGVEERAGKLPNPWQAALASALAFAAGAAIPLLAAGFVRPYWPRVGAMIGAVSLGLAGFGTVTAAAGKAPAVRSAVRVVMGGWVAMGITYALTKTIDAAGKLVGSASGSASA